MPQSQTLFQKFTKDICNLHFSELDQRNLNKIQMSVSLDIKTLLIYKFGCKQGQKVSYGVLTQVETDGNVSMSEWM